MTRRPPRLVGFDYASPGAYFITICTEERSCFFSSLNAYQIEKNEIGEAVSECWLAIPQFYSFVVLDVWVLMPNHLHGILWITEGNNSKKSLGQIVGSFKARSASQISKRGLTDRKIWQSDFYEHIIRSEVELFRIREYIANNPENWVIDHNNPNYKGGYVPPFDKYENVQPSTWLKPMPYPKP